MSLFRWAGCKFYFSDEPEGKCPPESDTSLESHYGPLVLWLRGSVVPQEVCVSSEQNPSRIEGDPSGPKILLIGSETLSHTGWLGQPCEREHYMGKDLWTLDYQTDMWFFLRPLPQSWKHTIAQDDLSPAAQIIF